MLYDRFQFLLFFFVLVLDKGEIDFLLLHLLFHHTRLLRYRFLFLFLFNLIENRVDDDIFTNCGSRF